VVAEALREQRARLLGLAAHVAGQARVARAREDPSPRVVDQPADGAAHVLRWV